MVVAGAVVLTGGAAAPVLIGAAIGAGSGGLISGGMAAIQGGDIKDIAKSFSDGFMWGAIGGSLSGGFSSLASSGSKFLSGAAGKGIDIVKDTVVDSVQTVVDTGKLGLASVGISLAINLATLGNANGSANGIRKEAVEEVRDISFVRKSDVCVRKSDVLAIGSSSRKSEWVEGSEIVATKAPKNFEVNMVMGQGKNTPGAWATQDAIDSVDYARNNLAITPEFKKDITHVQRYLIPEGTPIQMGIVGPQKYNGVTYPGGGRQIYILNDSDKDNLIPIGKPYDIK